VVGLDGDPAALGGAVTVALCGHWGHDGPCRWPHHTATEQDGESTIVTVRYVAPPNEVAEVRRLVSAAALATGRLTGPDGRVTTWRPATPGWEA
jgi:hypothetical protein